MTRVAALLALPWFAGCTLLLAELRWTRRPSLAKRLAPYASGAIPPDRTSLAGATFRDVLTPVADELASMLARTLGVTESLDRRLRRCHHPVDVSTYRLRQLAAAALGTVGGATVTIAIGPPPVVGVVLVVGPPLLAYAVSEQRVSAAAASWQRHVVLELPTIAEQLGMLTAAGWSLGSAVHRLGERGRGACATDLTIVAKRTAQGLTTVESLREWADRVDVEALHRLVGVLALNHRTTDLDRLIAEEAKAIRRDAHRELVARIERRTQMVWIPVTVAALLPGVLLMGVPFIEALWVFSS